MTEPTPQKSITQEQVRVAAQVGLELLTSETTVIPTAKMEAGLVLRMLLGEIAAGFAVVATVPKAAETPDSPNGGKKPPRRKRSSRKKGLRSVKSGDDT